jgi:hypothetical protein
MANSNDILNKDIDAQLKSVLDILGYVREELLIELSDSIKFYPPIDAEIVQDEVDRHSKMVEDAELVVKEWATRLKNL